MTRNTGKRTHLTATEVCAVKYGMLTPTHEIRGKSRRFSCKCQCGNTVKVNLASLVSGATKSCGCASNAFKTKHIVKSGDKFGRLTVIREHPERIKARSQETGEYSNRTYKAYDCICSCGAGTFKSDGQDVITGEQHKAGDINYAGLVPIKHNNLVSGSTKSCGCLKRESIKRVNENMWGKKQELPDE